MRESVALVTHTAICVYCIVTLLDCVCVYKIMEVHTALVHRLCHHCIFDLIVTRETMELFGYSTFPGRDSFCEFLL